MELGDKEAFGEDSVCGKTELFSFIVEWRCSTVSDH